MTSLKTHIGYEKLPAAEEPFSENKFRRGARLEPSPPQWYRALVRILQRANSAAIGAPTAVEASILLMRRFGSERHWVAQRLIEKLNLRIRHFDERHVAEAALAHERFGRGRHPHS